MPVRRCKVDLDFFQWMIIIIIIKSLLLLLMMIGCNRDFKIRWRPAMQRERQKRNRFLGKYNNLERAAHFFLYISLPCKTTTDKNVYILR